MWRLARKSLLSNRRRYGAIIAAVCVSVGFVCSGLVLSDTLSTMFRSIIGEANSGLDVVVRAPSKLASGNDTVRQPVPISMVEKLRAVPGVAAASPVVIGMGAIIGSDGKRVGGSGPPTVLANWIDDDRLNAMRIVTGRTPTGPDEVVIDQDAVRTGNLKVGEPVTILTPKPTLFRLVGTIRATNADGALGGATVSKTQLATVQKLTFDQAEPTGLATEIDIRGRDGVDEQVLRDRVAAALPTGTEAITASQQTEEILGEINTEFLRFVRTVLLAFAAVATVAAALTIANCFAIISNQRLREMALIRSIGASRSQVLGVSLVEAATLGLFASMLGLGLGIALASGLNSLLGNALKMVTVAPVVSATTVSVTLGLGVAVTLLAAIVPLVRMSRVSPIAALRHTAAEPATLPRRRVWGGAIAALIGAVMLGLGASGTGPPLAMAGLGSLIFTVAAVVLAPVFVRPLAAAVGFVSRGQSPRFARNNVTRSPRRAASSAAALTIGMAVVATITVMASSIITYVHEAVSDGIVGDLIVTINDGPLSSTYVDALKKRPEIGLVVAYQTVPAELDGSAVPVGVINPSEVTQVLKVSGPGATPWKTHLADNEVVISTAMAKHKNLHVGSMVTMRFLSGAHQMRVAGIHTSIDFLGPVAISDQLVGSTGSRPDTIAIVANAAPGVSIATAQKAADDAVRPLSGPKFHTGASYATSIGKQINNLLGIVYGLLGLSVLIALIGIGTSMSLSITERGRELSLLHAIGFDRRGLRRMVRWESALVAALGALVGCGIGVAVGAALMSAIRHDQLFGTVSIPLTTLSMVIVAGIAAGVIASVRPSRRAARLAGA